MSWTTTTPPLCSLVRVLESAITSTKHACVVIKTLRLATNYLRCLRFSLLVKSLVFGNKWSRQVFLSCLDNFNFSNFYNQPTCPCRNCFLAGRECQWVSWATKCQECARVWQGRCSFEETPEERMAHSEATYSWGHDSLTGEFSLFLSYRLFF